MPDESYKVEVGFFTKETISDLKQFESGVSRAISSLNNRQQATKGSGGIVSSILMGALFGRMSRNMSTLNKELERQKSQRRKSILQRQKNRNEDPYIRKLEETNKKLEEARATEIDRVLAEAETRHQEEIKKLLVKPKKTQVFEEMSEFKQILVPPKKTKVFEGMSEIKKELKSGKMTYKQLQVESKNKEFLQKQLEKEVIEKRELKKELLEKDKQINENIENQKKLKEEILEKDKQLKWQRDVYKIEMNENIENQKKLKEAELTIMDFVQKNKSSSLARSLGQQVRRQREAIQMGKEPKQLSSEAAQLQVENIKNNLKTPFERSKITEEQWSNLEQNPRREITPIEDVPERIIKEVFKPQRKISRKKYKREYEEEQRIDYQKTIDYNRRKEQSAYAGGE